MNPWLHRFLKHLSCSSASRNKEFDMKDDGGVRKMRERTFLERTAECWDFEVIVWLALPQKRGHCCDLPPTQSWRGQDGSWRQPPVEEAGPGLSKDKETFRCVDRLKGQTPRCVSEWLKKWCVVIQISLLSSFTHWSTAVQSECIKCCQYIS